MVQAGRWVSSSSSWEFDPVEAAWAASQKPTYVTDRRGIVLITSIPSWRFMTIGEIPANALVAIRESLQFGEAPLRPLPFRQAGDLDGGNLVEVVMPGSTGATEFLDLKTPVPTTPWTLQHLVETAPSFDAATREGRLLALLGLLPVLAAGALLLRRRHVASLRISEALRAREELERRVLERTADLSQARDRLQMEITDHRNTEQTLQAVQQDLVQANRLAILGQVAAGVAHEINQPVATIRAYADNARVFLERGQGGVCCRQSWKYRRADGAHRRDHRRIAGALAQGPPRRRTHIAEAGDRRRRAIAS